MSDILSNTKNKLSEISSSFCVAKWSHATIYLHNGMGNSCHHPKFHQADEKRVLENPRELLNTPQKLIAREKMLNNQRPPECIHCWTYEDADSRNYSDRIVKSASSWAKDEVSRIMEDPLSLDFLPRYLEVSFSDVCNLKCVYCGPHFSTSWQNELRGLEKSTKTSEISESDIYRLAFWKLWPELIPNLRVLRVTGGEPLLSQDVFELLNKLMESDNHELVLIINSNLSVKSKVLHKYFEILNKLIDQKKVKEVKIVTSQEATGKASDYIRNGIDQSFFWENLEDILTADKFNLSITATLNVLCVGELAQLYQKCSELKRRYETNKQHFFIDPTLLKSPSKLNILNFPDNIKTKFINECEDILLRANELKLDQFEIFRLTNVKRVVSSKLGFCQISDIKDLQYFLKDLDNKRNQSFAKTFPDLYKDLLGEL